MEADVGKLFLYMQLEIFALLAIVMILWLR